MDARQQSGNLRKRWVSGYFIFKETLINQCFLSTIAKMTHGEPVAMTVLVKICDALNCGVGDIFSIKRAHKEGGYVFGFECRASSDVKEWDAMKKACEMEKSI